MRWLIGLSGGINSMAVLCWLSEQTNKPDELHLYYAHFDEHSPDTWDFVQAGITYAKQHFKSVVVKITYNSVLKFFEQENMIPHPKFSPCSRKLKIEPIAQYGFENEITVDLIGYVKHELKKRAGNQQAAIQPMFFEMSKEYPIGEFTDAWCFEIVDRCIGWHPAIYDIFWTEEDYNEGLCSKRDVGKRVFSHNNCLPCKNGDEKHLKAVKKYYPPYHLMAMKLSALLTAHWGRDKDKFYSEFGRELGQDVTCETCKF